MLWREDRRLGPVAKLEVCLEGDRWHGLLSWFSLRARKPKEMESGYIDSPILMWMHAE